MREGWREGGTRAKPGNMDSIGYNYVFKMVDVFTT